MSVTLNQSLKPYQESITHEIGSLKTIVNLCPSGSNIIVEIPIFKTFGVRIMTPSLIYNYQFRNSGGLFKGAKLNYFPTLYKNGNDIYINNPDGTIDYYDGYNNTNLETDSYVYYSYSGMDYYILNNSGVIVSKFDYDSFGNIINQTGTIISNFRYKGYYHDSDLELYYLKSRFYNPVIKLLNLLRSL